MIINGFDALIATSNANIFYTSDVYPFDQSFTLLPLDRSIEPARAVKSLYIFNIGLNYRCCFGCENTRRVVCGPRTY